MKEVPGHKLELSYRLFQKKGDIAVLAPSPPTNRIRVESIVFLLTLANCKLS